MRQKFIQLVFFLLLAVPALMAADMSETDSNKVMIEMKVNNDSSRFNTFEYDIFSAVDSTGVSNASHVTNDNVLQIWGIEKGRRYFVIITPYYKSDDKLDNESNGGTKVNLGGGITRVAGGTLLQRTRKYTTAGKNDIRIDVDITADFQTEEKRTTWGDATPKSILVFILPELNIAQY